MICERGAPSKIMAGTDMNSINVLENAWLSVEDGRVTGIGSMDEYNAKRFEGFELVPLKDKTVLPSWVDSHTHLVFANWRNREFEDRIRGLSYEEIANRGGGILNSAAAMAHADEDELFDSAMKRLHEVMAQGTGAIEIKSGYGLTLKAELKMLRVIKRIKSAAAIPVKTTFLAAHAVPADYKGRTDEYVDLVINEMIPAVHAQGGVDYIDAFCEKGYFDVDQSMRIIQAGTACGWKAKVHVNQFNALGGVRALVKADALSLDHLELLTDDDLDALKNGNTMPVALPSCSFFLSIPYTPARKIIDAGLPLALATDYNPGSTPSGNMNFVVALACIKMNMTPQEAINAATINGAAAIELNEEVGSLGIGKRANFNVFPQMEEVSLLPYRFGDLLLEQAFINGEAFSG